MSDEVKPTTDDTAADTAVDTTVDNPDARPPDFSDLNDSRLRASWDKLQKQFEGIKAKPTSGDTLAEGRKIRMEQSQIATEMRKRAADATKLREEMEALDGEDVALPELPGQEVDEVEDDVLPTPTAGNAPAAPVPAMAAGATAPSADEVAAARGGKAVAKRGSTLPAAPRRAAWVAAAAAQDGSVQFGAPIELSELGDQLGRLSKARGRHKTVLASLPGFTDEGGPLLSDMNGRVVNDGLISEAVEAWEIRTGLRTVPSHGAKTAAICEPLDIIRDIPNPGRSKETPFGSSLPFRGAGRLGFTFTRAMQIADVASGTSIWTESDQAAIDATDENTWKAVYCVTCGTPVDTTAEELTWGLCYEESTELSSPERVADALDALMTVEKRVREGYLLRRFDLLSSGASWATPSIGAMPDLIEMITRRIEAAAYTERLELPGATVWIPPGLIAAMNIDRARKAYDTDYPSALAELKAGVPDGVNVIQLRDISDNLDADADIPNEAVGYGAGESLALPAAARTALTHTGCATFRIRWGWPSAFIAYSTGMTNFGVLRDAALIRQNKAIQFGREWLGLDKHGPQASGYVDMTISISGIRGALLATSDDDTIVCSSTS